MKYYGLKINTNQNYANGSKSALLEQIHTEVQILGVTGRDVKDEEEIKTHTVHRNSVII